MQTRVWIAALILRTIALGADILGGCHPGSNVQQGRPTDLQRNCQSCHRPGQIAPMSFLRYESTRPWAKAMKAAVASRKMRP